MRGGVLGAGNVWAWTAIDPESNLIRSWMVGDRDAETASYFMDDLASRLADRVQLTTDGHKAYLDAVASAFEPGAVDYAMLVKLYGEPSTSTPECKYSPADCLGARKELISGNPDKAHVSTSHVERANLTMRMSKRCITRLTNAFSKKIDNDIQALSLYRVWYNFARQHKAHTLSPAMAAGLTDKLWRMEDVAELIDARAPKPGKRGPHKKRP